MDTQSQINMKNLFLLLAFACITYSAFTQHISVDTTIPNNELQVAGESSIDSSANAADSLRRDKKVVLCSVRFTEVNTWSIAGKNSTQPAINFNKINVEDYKYNADNQKILYTGFVTREHYTLYPQHTKPDPWVVDYNRITPLLVRSMQERKKIMEGQKAQTDPPRSKVGEVLMLITDFIRN
jgi:hypothetical protein